jgi:hypothetical protein
MDRATSPAISVVLDQVLTTERAVSVGELFDRVEERGFGLLLPLIVVYWRALNWLIQLARTGLPWFAP